MIEFIAGLSPFIAAVLILGVVAYLIVESSMGSSMKGMSPEHRHVTKTTLKQIRYVFLAFTVVCAILLMFTYSYEHSVHNEAKVDVETLSAIEEVQDKTHEEVRERAHEAREEGLDIVERTIPTQTREEREADTERMLDWKRVAREE